MKLFIDNTFMQQTEEVPFELLLTGKLGGAPADIRAGGAPMSDFRTICRDITSNAIAAYMSEECHHAMAN